MLRVPRDIVLCIASWTKCPISISYLSSTCTVLRERLRDHPWLQIVRSRQTPEIVELVYQLECSHMIRCKLLFQLDRAYFKRPCHLLLLRAGKTANYEFILNVLRLARFRQKFTHFYEQTRVYAVICGLCIAQRIDLCCDLLRDFKLRAPTSRVVRVFLYSDNPPNAAEEAERAEGYAYYLKHRHFFNKTEKEGL